MLVVVALALLVGGEATLDLLAGAGGLVFDLIEENLEAFYLKFAKLDIHRAQMATAYTYFFLLLAVGLLLGRRVIAALKRWFDEVASFSHRQSDKIHRIYDGHAASFMMWWNSLDWLNKIAVAVAGVLGAIPFFLLLSYGLGMAVAELL